MKYRADKKLVEKIDTPIWGALTVRIKLHEFLEKDTEILYDLINSEFDDEFDLYGKKVIEYAESVDVELDEAVSTLIEYVQSKTDMERQQALTLILDIIEVFLINGKRMCG